HPRAAFDHHLGDAQPNAAGPAGHERGFSFEAGNRLEGSYSAVVLTPAAAIPAAAQAASSAPSAPETPIPPKGTPSALKNGRPPCQVARLAGPLPQFAVSDDGNRIVAAERPFHIANSATAVAAPSICAKEISRPASSYIATASFRSRSPAQAMHPSRIAAALA